MVTKCDTSYPVYNIKKINFNHLKPKYSIRQCVILKLTLYCALTLNLVEDLSKFLMVYFLIVYNKNLEN